MHYIPATVKTVIFFTIFFLTPISAQAQQSNIITDFRFTSDATGLEEDLIGDIDNENYTITFTTQKWIENIAQLPATFEVGGDVEIKVSDTGQESGITTNDFRKDVVYTIGNDVSYTVKFASPQASGLPVIKIDTENGAAITSKEIYSNMVFALTDCNHPENNVSKTDMKDQVRGRGNDSWFNPVAKKKSYRIKFNKKTSLFGLEAAKSWVLIAQYRDATLLYNATAFELGNRLALPFNHSFNFVELYLNGEYAGNYLLTEQNQVGAGRVDINEDEGWFVELDGYYDEEPKFKTTNYHLPVMIKSPEFEPADISNPAYDFVRNELNALTNAVASSGFPENGYRDLIDMNTFIDFLMINEICDNKEIETPMSTYMYKDKDGLISMGPLWDFDCGYGYGYNYNHYYSPDTRTPVNDFFKRLFDDPVFFAKYKERWNNKYTDIASIPDFMDETAGRLGKSAEQNFQTWWYRTYAPWTDTRPYEPNDFSISVSKLKDYYKAHVSYLNSELNQVDVLPTSKNFITYARDYDFIPQTFTLVAYGDITDLQATLFKAESSDFEIGTGFGETQITENGGFLATINVKPKKSLIESTSDVLMITGSNQGNPFSLKIPLNFEIKTDPVYTIPTNLTATYGQTLADIALPDGWSWMDHTLPVGNVGQQTHQAKFTLNDLIIYNIDVSVVVIVKPTIVSVISYSGITDGTPADIYQRSYVDFQKDMEFIAGQGYEVVSTDDLPDIQQGIKTISSKAIVLAFDKGMINDLDLVVPVLQEHGFKATFFVIPERVGTGGYMSWNDLESLLQIINQCRLLKPPL